MPSLAPSRDASADISLSRVSLEAIPRRKRPQGNVVRCSRALTPRGARTVANPLGAGRRAARYGVGLGSRSPAPLEPQPPCLACPAPCTMASLISFQPLGSPVLAAPSPVHAGLFYGSSGIPVNAGTQRPQRATEGAENGYGVVPAWVHPSLQGMAGHGRHRNQRKTRKVPRPCLFPAFQLSSVTSATSVLLCGFCGILCPLCSAFGPGIHGWSFLVDDGSLTLKTED
jgi:hypothetical protein